MQRIPAGEDDQRDGQPAAVAEAVVRPCSAAEIQAPARAVDVPRQIHRQQNREVGQEAVGEQHLAQHRNVLEQRQLLAEGAGRGGHGYLAHAAGQLGQGTAEEVAHAHAEGGQRQTGDILVGAQGDGQHAVDQSAQRARQQRAHQRDQKAHHGNRRHRRLLIEERARQTGNAAHVHHARHAQIQVARLFRQDLAVGSEENADALSDGLLNKGDNHARWPPFFE